jgi:Putative holin
MLVGTSVGIVAGIGVPALVHIYIRPDVVVALVVGIPSLIGLTLVLFSTRRWLTAWGAFLLAVSPGWFGALVAIQAVNSG